MQQMIFDSETNSVIGTVTVPDDIIRKARELRRWMSMNRCSELAGLKLQGHLTKEAVRT